MIKVKETNSIKDITALKAKAANTWKDAIAGYAKVHGAWQQIWPEKASITTATLAPAQTQEAEYKNEDGTTEKYTKYESSILNPDAITFQKATKKQYDIAKDESTITIISSSDSEVPIYSWLDSGNNQYYYTEADKIYFPEDSCAMFSIGMISGKISKITSLDLSSCDTSKVTSMDIMFSDCRGLTSLDLSSFDTSKVTSMACMLQSCSSLTSLNLSSFDTSNVTNMNGMFNESLSLTSLDLSSFDTSKVTDMSYMFFECGALSSIYVSETFVVNSNALTEDAFNGAAKLPNYSSIINNQVDGFKLTTQGGCLALKS